MWSGPLGVVVLVIILVGVAGLAYRVMRTSGPIPLPRRPDERDARDVERSRRIERLLHRNGSAARGRDGAPLPVLKWMPTRKLHKGRTD
jgi:hypothetical protein